ncbi:MAG: hypothetical protein IT210_25785, partial [Armatimonadetes bacterium]|nr:hypothetical protein [Armatimonadota bacterium]
MNAKPYILGLILALASVAPLWSAPSASLKVGWYPPGGYTQEMQRITSGTVGSSIDAIVDITYAASEGPYTIPPKDILFSEGSDCPNQTTTFSASILQYTPLTDYPS